MHSSQLLPYANLSTWSLMLFCCSAIRQSLISSGKFEAALLVCNKYQLDRAGVYASWGLSELSIGGQEHFKLAKDKFRHYYQVCSCCWHVSRSQNCVCHIFGNMCRRVFSANFALSFGLLCEVLLRCCMPMLSLTDCPVLLFHSFFAQ